MITSYFSKTGAFLVGVYSLIFAYTLYVAIVSCPDMLCSLGLNIATIPWSLLFEPPFNIFDLPRLYGTSLYAVSTVFFVLNSTLLYRLGILLGGIARRIHARFHS